LQADQLLRERLYPVIVNAPQRKSIRTLRPTVQPKSASAWVNAELLVFATGRLLIVKNSHPGEGFT
jgi:hypothetical protein